VKGSPTWPVLLVNFVNALSYSIILPFFVFLVRRFGGEGYVYGLLVAAFPAFQLVGAPLLGRWSDRYGRRRILLLSEAGTVAAWALFLVALYLPTTVLVDRSAFGALALRLPRIVPPRTAAVGEEAARA
jgi:MFS family permease